MASRRCVRAAVTGLVAAAAATIPVAGCTASSGRHSPAGSPAARTGSAAPGTPAVSICSRPEIRAAISDFFDTWNRRDAAALGRLFAAAGELDLTTKHQHAVDGSDSWSSAGGATGARGQISAFAERQWRLGERLSYRGVQVVMNGGTYGHGGYVSGVVARFGDGAVQPMGYAKFIYGCTSRAFLHVVIVSARAASLASTSSSAEPAERRSFRITSWRPWSPSGLLPGHQRGPGCGQDALSSRQAFD